MRESRVLRVGRAGLRVSDAGRGRAQLGVRAAAGKKTQQGLAGSLRGAESCEPCRVQIRGLSG